MKKFFPLIVFLATVMMAYAQVGLVATLSHEGTHSHYYGIDALKSAYNAANHGDIVTLSSGTFNTPESFEKAITLRGVGYETRIQGESNFYSNDSTHVMTIEGVRFSEGIVIYNRHCLKGQGSIRFVKNWIGNYMKTVPHYGTTGYSSDGGPQVSFYKCDIDRYYLKENSYPRFAFYNSYIWSGSWGMECDAGPNSSIFVNCWFAHGGSFSWESSKDLCYYNCVFMGNGLYTQLPESAVLVNCLSINNDKLFDRSMNKVNCNNAGGDIVVGWCTLSEEAKAMYVGTDGTEVGLFGGLYPWNDTLQYPIITKLSGDAQTTDKGILNVEIQVDNK